MAITITVAITFTVAATSTVAIRITITITATITAGLAPCGAHGRCQTSASVAPPDKKTTKKSALSDFFPALPE